MRIASPKGGVGPGKAGRRALAPGGDRETALRRRFEPSSDDPPGIAGDGGSAREAVACRLTVFDRAPDRLAAPGPAAVANRVHGRLASA